LTDIAPHDEDLEWCILGPAHNAETYDIVDLSGLTLREIVAVMEAEDDRVGVYDVSEVEADVFLAIAFEDAGADLSAGEIVEGKRLLAERRRPNA
jgi:hypothetical protein